MDSSTIDLYGSEIASIELEDGDLHIVFSRAIIIKTISGSKQRTRWWQPGSLIFEQAEVTGELPTGPFECLGGDVSENIYTYRDMLPLPLQSQGVARCELKLAGIAAPLRAQAAGVRLEMQDRPYYIEHIDG